MILDHFTSGGHAARLTIGLDPGPTMARPPLFAGAKDRCLSHRAADFPNCTATKRPPPLLHRQRVPYRWGPPCAMTRTKKISTAHTATEKPLAGSTVTWFNF